MTEVKVFATFRHTQPMDFLKRFVERRILPSVEAQGVLSVESKDQRFGEVTVPPPGEPSTDRRKTADLSSAIDLVLNTIE